MDMVSNVTQPSNEWQAELHGNKVQSSTFACVVPRGTCMHDSFVRCKGLKAKVKVH